MVSPNYRFLCGRVHKLRYGDFELANMLLARGTNTHLVLHKLIRALSSWGPVGVGLHTNIWFVTPLVHTFKGVLG
jgi:hypothetical protein